MSEERKEGWGAIVNARDVHYFRDGRTLCGRWMALGPPRWEKYQDLGKSATKGTCKECWKKRAKEDVIMSKINTTQISEQNKQ